MADLASLFSSRAKTKVLRTLSCQSAPLPLRQIASLSDSPLFSVQRVLQQLTDEKIILRKKKGNLVLFALDQIHPAFSLLKQIFDLEMQDRIASSSNDYRQKAKGILDFSCAAQRLLARGREWI